MERRRTTLVASILLALALALAGCGDDGTDPDEVLDRALTRQNLAGFINAEGGGRVAVEALGYEEAILDRRDVEATPEVMIAIGEALGSTDSRLPELIEGLEYDGSDQVAGVVVDHVSGELESEGLADALGEAGAGDVAGLAGVGQSGDLDETLAGADFDLYVGQADGVIRRLDLTLSLDDPDNALPPTRIRFSLTPVHSPPASPTEN